MSGDLGIIERLMNRIQLLESKINGLDWLRREVTVLKTKLDPDRRERLSPREIATRYRVGIDKVRKAIERGELTTYPERGKGGRLVQYIRPVDAARFFSMPPPE